MVLGVDKLLELVHNDSLVSNLSERELTNPEGCGFDFRLGKVHKISGEGFLGISERKTSDIKTIAEFVEGESKIIEIKPGEHIFVTTVEKVKLPENLTMNMQLRSTLYRCGIIMSGGNTAPGYEGELSFTLFNSGPVIMKIEMGARIVHATFWEVKGKSNAYRGQWKGGRINTNKLEKQV